jgi:osmotically-inducible protein OsmY
MKSAFARLSCGVLMSGALLLAPRVQAKQAQAPDNTAVNKADRNGSQPNADNAKNTKTDLQLQSQIRRDVVKDKSLSTYGHNVKIIATHGKVTLRGPVHSEDEKKTIEDYARRRAGDGNVVDEITVKGDKK